MLKHTSSHTKHAVLFFVFSAAEIAGAIGLYKFLDKGTSFSLGRLMLCVILCLVLMTMTLGLLSGCNPLFGNDSRPSPVDAAPLASLTAAQIENLEDAFEGFRDLDYIIRFEVADKENIGSHLYKTYDLFWLQNEPHSLLYITVCFYKDEQRAVDNLNSWVSLCEKDEKKYTLISNNNNNTEALLCDSRMIRTSDTFYAPNSQRYIRSILRIGSVVITLSEDQKYNNLDKNISTKFIKQLCEMTKDKDQ